MNATTIDDQVGGLRRRLDVLQALAQLGVADERSRVRYHLDELDRIEADARAAARRGGEDADAKLRQLKTRLAIAEYALVADLSDDWEAFELAVEGELRCWDAYLARLEANVAASAIADVRRRRIALDAHLAHARVAATARQERRQFVTTTRDELGRMVDELSTKLN